MNVETHIPTHTSQPLTLLQWSHVLMNVETNWVVREAGSPQRASMEPRPHERGNRGNCPAKGFQFK